MSEDLMVQLHSLLAKVGPNGKDRSLGAIRAWKNSDLCCFCCGFKVILLGCWHLISAKVHSCQKNNVTHLSLLYQRSI